MARYGYRRRRTDIGQRWRIDAPDGTELAQATSYEKAAEVAKMLNEVRELRVLLAVAAKQLSPCQAAAMLNCSSEELQRKINTCLARGYK